MRALITILDNITETSMPFNEFVLYRANHFSDERQILIVCGPKKELPKVEIPASLEIHYTGKNLFKIRKTVQRVMSGLTLQNTPYVIHLHQIKSAFLAEIAMLFTGFHKKVLFTVHSTFSGYSFHNKVLSFVNALFAKRITCVSNTSYDDYPHLIKKIKGDRISALQNGVDTERIDRILSERTEKQVKKEANTVEFIYVARLIPLKNHQFLIDVLSGCDQKVHFTFIGAEDLEGAVRKKAKELGVIDRVTFTGLIPRNDVFPRLASADYYISSSTLEGLPVSVLEAMYCGLPCVLSDIPQHREAANKETVILPFDKSLWVKELNRLAPLSPEERENLSKNTKKHVAEHFSLAAMHEKYDAIYKTL